MSNLAGFIECKKVGVEQTIDSAHKRRYGGGNQILPYNTPLTVRFAPRWAEACKYSFLFKRTAAGTRVDVAQNGRACHSEIISDGCRLIVGMTLTGAPFFLGDAESLRDIPDSIRACRILEIASSTKEGVNCILNNCLAGPQTPEKAKQASFVALDVRKGLTGQFDKRPDESKCVSILAMTIFSHWEPKSINMVRASIDYNLVVDDALIIEAMEEYEKAFGVDFLQHITKEIFVKDPDTQAIATNIVQQKDGRIFRDIEDNQYKAITISNSGLVIVE